jgi:hypothetical protein
MNGLGIWSIWLSVLCAAPKNLLSGCRRRRAGGAGTIHFSFRAFGKMSLTLFEAKSGSGIRLSLMYARNRGIAECGKTKANIRLGQKVVSAFPRIFAYIIGNNLSPPKIKHLAARSARIPRPRGRLAETTINPVTGGPTTFRELSAPCGFRAEPGDLNISG